MEVSMSRLIVRRFAVMVLTGVIFAAFSWGVSVQAQQSPTVFLSVVDRSGAPVTNLQPSEVKLVLDDMACESTKVEPIGWPLKLTVLIDNGDAIVSSLTSLREGLRRFLAEIPEGVETELLSYSPQPRWIVRPTTDRQQLVKGVDLVAPNSGSGAKFLDAVGEAVNRIAREKGDSFHTIMVITTNGPEGSGGNVNGIVEKMQRQLTERPATVHVAMVAISTTQSVGRVSGATQTQIGVMLTKMTGGRYENIAIANRLPVLLTEYGKQIARSHLLQSRQYRLSCDKSPSKAPKISVSTSNPSVADLTLTRDGLIP
ncbi:MAG: hypothetical protein A3H95_10760 [Acidobacteria bacterium RIFCSPLOWO2_02_FULL_64_15]|nr:MAG: hypothetical protein A3H95_10760 [Acidobacteria bacterium RIFCSPLOWO2_02_FULL_64_15]